MDLGSRKDTGFLIILKQTLKEKDVRSCVTFIINNGECLEGQH